MDLSESNNPVDRPENAFQPSAEPASHRTDPPEPPAAPPQVPAGAASDPAAPPAAPPADPPKPLATYEDKLKLLRDDALLSQLEATIRAAKRPDGSRAVLPRDVDDMLQLTLIAMMKAPVPKAPEEITPYCKQIAENISIKLSGARTKKPDANAVSLDDGKRAEWVQSHASNPESTLGARQVIGGLLSRTVGWGAHRAWLRSSVMDEAPHAEIAAKAGVETVTVRKTLSLRRQQLRRVAIKELLVFLASLGCLRVFIGGVMYRPEQVSASPLGPLARFLSLDVASLLLAELALAVFALVAWRTRAHRAVIVSALGSAALFAAYTARLGKVQGAVLPTFGTFSGVDTDTQAYLLYGAQALVVVGAGSLLAWAAKRAYGLKGFVGVALGVPIVAVLVGLASGGTLTRGWFVGTMVEVLMLWQWLLLVLYALVAWVGRRPRASLAVEKAVSAAAAR